MKQPIPPEMIRKMFQPEPFIEKGQFIGRPVISTEFQNYKVVAVGSRVYPKLPLNITFHEFLIIFLKDILGKEWGIPESKKPKEQQHIIVQWITEMGELVKNSQYRIENAEKDIKSIEPSGNVQSLLSLAYDIYSIYHCSELPDELVARLRNNDQFQGAKYEIAVAGIFARAGFKINWFPRSTEKQCEFIAIHRVTKEQIIVEAKSRHRQGVLNRPGVKEDLIRMKAQVGHLFNEALKKPTGIYPFMVFIDINLPLTEGNNSLNKRWVGDVKKMLDKHPKGTFEPPDPFTALFITNFAWHYQENQADMKKGEEITIIPLYPKYRTKDANMVSLLHDAVNQYGVVPGLFPDNKPSAG